MGGGGINQEEWVNYLLFLRQEMQGILKQFVGGA